MIDDLETQRFLTILTRILKNQVILMTGYSYPSKEIALACEETEEVILVTERLTLKHVNERYDDPSM